MNRNKHSRDLWTGVISFSSFFFFLQAHLSPRYSRHTVYQRIIKSAMGVNVKNTVQHNLCSNYCLRRRRLRAGGRQRGRVRSCRDGDERWGGGGGGGAGAGGGKVWGVGRAGAEEGRGWGSAPSHIRGPATEMLAKGGRVDWRWAPRCSPRSRSDCVARCWEQEGVRGKLWQRGIFPLWAGLCQGWGQRSECKSKDRACNCSICFGATSQVRYSHPVIFNLWSLAQN